MDAAFLYPDDRSKIFEETGFVFPKWNRMI